jgi:hypothetical protein
MHSCFAASRPQGEEARRLGRRAWFLQSETILCTRSSSQRIFLVQPWRFCVAFCTSTPTRALVFGTRYGIRSSLRLEGLGTTPCLLTALAALCLGWPCKMTGRWLKTEVALVPYRLLRSVVLWPALMLGRLAQVLALHLPALQVPAVLQLAETLRKPRVVRAVGQT